MTTGASLYYLLNLPVPHILRSDGAEYAVGGPHGVDRGTIRPHVLQKPAVAQVPVEPFSKLLSGRHGIIQTIPVNPISCPQSGWRKALLQSRQWSGGLHRRQAHLGGPPLLDCKVALLAAGSPFIVRKTTPSVPEGWGSSWNSRMGSRTGIPLIPHCSCTLDNEPTRSYNSFILFKRVCGGAGLSWVAQTLLAVSQPPGSHSLLQWNAFAGLRQSG